MQQSPQGGVGEEKRKPRGEMVRYSPEFLMKFAEVRFVCICKRVSGGGLLVWVGTGSGGSGSLRFFKRGASGPLSSLVLVAVASNNEYQIMSE